MTSSNSGFFFVANCSGWVNGLQSTSPQSRDSAGGVATGAGGPCAAADRDGRRARTVRRGDAAAPRHNRPKAIPLQPQPLVLHLLPALPSRPGPCGQDGLGTLRACSRPPWNWLVAMPYWRQSSAIWTPGGRPPPRGPQDGDRVVRRQLRPAASDRADAGGLDGDAGDPGEARRRANHR
jgi:hypothetical protein